MPQISLAAEQIFHIGSFPVTNSLFLSLVVMAIFFILALFLHKNIKEIPGKVQSIFEVLLEQILELMDSVLGSREKSEKYLPLVATVFLFIMFSNWLGIFPFGAFTVHTTEGAVPLFRSPASDLNFTIALGIISVVAVNALAIKALGTKRHLAKFFNFSNPINTFTGFLELLSEFVRIVSFSFRLFGNVFAGEVLLLIVGLLVPYGVPLPFMFLEVFVGFIQAFIFAMLTLVFLATAVAEDAHH